MNQNHSDKKVSLSLDDLSAFKNFHEEIRVSEESTAMLVLPNVLVSFGGALEAPFVPGEPRLTLLCIPDDNLYGLLARFPLGFSQWESPEDQRTGDRVWATHLLYSPPPCGGTMAA